MRTNEQESLKTLEDIRAMMNKSAKFISLSGWSGIWAGAVGLAGAYVAHLWLSELPGAYYNMYRSAPDGMEQQAFNEASYRFLALAVAVLLLALAGGYYFTWKKVKHKGERLWNTASRKMLVHMAVPMMAGGLFSLLFLVNGHEMYIAPACLVFYGLALINGGKYTLSDIGYLGYLELCLGCVSMLFPGYGLTSWAIGFGALHIIYGIIVWNKYDNGSSRSKA